MKHLAAVYARALVLVALLGAGCAPASAVPVAPTAKAAPVESSRASPAEEERTEEAHWLMQIMGTVAGRAFARLGNPRPLGPVDMFHIADAAKTVEWSSRILRRRHSLDDAQLARMGEFGKTLGSWGNEHLPTDEVSPDAERAARAALAALRSVCQTCHEQALRDGRMHNYNEVAPP